MPDITTEATDAARRINRGIEGLTLPDLRALVCDLRAAVGPPVGRDAADIRVWLHAVASDELARRITLSTPSDV